MKKPSILILFALMALITPMAWAQTPVTAGSEDQLRTYLSNSSTEYTINLVNDITIQSAYGDIPVNYGKTLNMNGHTISVHPQVGVPTRLFIVQAGAQFTINGSGTLSGHTNTDDGGLIYVNQNAMLTLAGANLTLNINGSVNNGGAIYVANGGNASLNGATLAATYASGVTVANGGIIYNAGTLAMDIGTTTLSGGHATNGGALYVAGGQFTSGGETTFSNNTATNGGALYMNGGTATCDAAFSGNTATNGGALCVAGGSFSQTNGTGFTNNTASNYGGAVYGLGGTAILNADISGCSSTADRGIYVAANGTVGVSGGTITGSSTSSYSVVRNLGTFIMGGGDITGNSCANGGGIYNQGTLNLDGSARIHHCTANQAGGGIYNEGILNLEGGSIDTCSVSGSASNPHGGGIYNHTDASITMNSGFITGCTAPNGGGIYNNDGGSITINGGYISSNSCGEDGGAIVNRGTLTMTGGAITHNSAANDGGGICSTSPNITITGGLISDNVANTGNNAQNPGKGGGIEARNGITMSGTPIVTGNSGSNLYLPSGKRITVNGTFGATAHISVTHQDGITTITSGFASHHPETYPDLFLHTDNPDYMVTQNNDYEAFISQNVVSQIAANSTVEYLDIWEDGNRGTKVCTTWTPMSHLADTDPILSHGWYVVDANMTFNTRITAAGDDVNIILPDLTTLTANKGIDVTNGSTLHIWAQSFENAGGIIAYGDDNHAGIGGDGRVHIHCGSINAFGGLNAPGVKASHLHNALGETGVYGLYIYDGAVIAVGGEYGAGIGGGYLTSNSTCGNIKITGGTVVAYGGMKAAGIGGGYRGLTSDVASAGYSGQIGQNFTEVRITGGIVFAWGNSGAGIGGGEGTDTNMGTPADVYIDGGVVNANTTNMNAPIQKGNGIMGGSVAIGWGYQGFGRFGYLHIYEGAKVTAAVLHSSLSGTIVGPMILRDYSSGRDDYVGYKKIKIEPCDHPNVNLTYTDNQGDLTTNCPYCHTHLPYTFQTEGDWNTNTNWLGNFMPGEGSDVAVKAAATIPHNCTAHVDTIYMQEGGSILIKDGGQLIHSNEGVTATVEKHIAGYGTSDGGYHLIANPVQEALAPANLGMTTGSYDLYWFDQSQELEWQNYKQNSFDLENGTGYLYANSANNDIAFNGVLNRANADISVPVTHDADAEFPGFNLVGNPFVCNAYLADGRDFYVLDDDRDEIVTATSNVIAPMQAVFVQATTSESTVSFTTTAPSKGMALDMSVSHHHGAVVDNARIRFGEGQSLEKFQLDPSHSKLYIPQDGKDYAVVNTKAEGELPVSFKAKENGSYTISVSPENVEFGYLHLVDNLTGADVDLLATPSYTFTVCTNDYASRFRLVFSTICGDADGDNETFAFVSNGEIVITGVGDALNASLQVVDVMGRIVVSRMGDVSGNVSTSGMTPGVYVLRLINGDDVKTQKIVIE